MLKRYLPRLAGVLAVAAVMFMAGCVQQGTPVAEQGPGGGDAAPAGQNVTLDSSVRWTECLGMNTGKDYPYGTEQPPAPPGWEPRGVYVASYTVYVAVECERVSIGPFERGPVHFFFESHTAYSPPEQCMAQPGPFVATVLHTLWVDDEEIAAYLAQYGDMPVGVMEATLQADDSMGVTQHAWQWSVNGSTSQLTLPDDGARTANGQRDIRFLWHNGTAAGELRVSFDIDGPLFTERWGHGEFHEPFLMASDDPYVQPIMHLEGDLSGAIKLYDDISCSEQAWP